MRHLSRLAVLLVCLALVLVPISAQAPDSVTTWLNRVNEARLDEGLAAYRPVEPLIAAAQRHADDLAANVVSSHIGSDASTPEQRIAGAGYAAWTLDSGEPVVGEIFWIGTGTIDDALGFFLADPPSRDSLLSTVYREIGIGVATDDAGRKYYVLNFGARPNVLPISINDGAPNTEVPQIAIRLTNEEARSSGQGSYMGWAIEIRIGNDPNWDILPWQSWEPLVPWTLPDTPGEHTVYVQLRDAAGRTAASADSIWLGEEVPATPVPLSTVEVNEVPVLEATQVPVETTVPEQSPTASPAAEPIPITVTPFPTWTPLPTPTVAQEAGDSDPPLALVAALQGLALILGIYLVLHRGRGQQDAGDLDGR